MSIRTFQDKKPGIAPSTFVDESAVVIGDVHLADDVSIWPLCVLRGDINKITIGARSNIQDGTIIHVNHASEFNPEGDPVILGEEVVVGHQVVLHGCTIENNVLIGIGAKVIDGAHIESDVMVGAGSLVTPNKTLVSGYLYMGIPAKQIRKLTDQEKAYLRYNAQHYSELKELHKDSMKN